MIEIRRLRVVFGRTVALDDVDLDFSSGVVGVFGPNGAGKSTLLRAVAGLVRPTSGSVLIHGLTPQSVRGSIGFAGHALGLYPRLTVSENLQLFGRLYGAPARRAAVVVDQLGLTARAAAPVGELSAGLKSRAAIARAMLHEPQVLILDEPYAHQDDEAADLVSEAVKGWRRGDRVAIIATHGAKRLKAFADARVTVRQGHVTAALRSEDIAERARARR